MAGGLGTRLRSIESSAPKPMIKVNEIPFLQHLVQHYVKLDFTEIIFSIGYMGHVIESYPWSTFFKNVNFKFVHEKELLGTGGAVKKIFAELGLKNAWVVNGDTFLPCDLPVTSKFLDAHYCLLKREHVFDATPNIKVSGDFVISEGGEGDFFDAGAVWVSANAIASGNSPEKCSIHQLLSCSMKSMRVKYTVLETTCYDIGTPERYNRFVSYLRNRE